jgi:hypothetical protein
MPLALLWAPASQSRHGRFRAPDTPLLPLVCASLGDVVEISCCFREAGSKGRGHRCMMLPVQKICTGGVCMSRMKWAVMLITGAVLVGVTGCGNASNASSNTNSSATTGWQGQGQARTLKPNIAMQTTPAKPTAGKAFTLDFTIERPNRGGNGHAPRSTSGSNHPGNWAGGTSFNHVGNWTGGSGNGQPRVQRTAEAHVTGQSVNETIQLTNQNGGFEGQATLAKPGQYEVTFTMKMGPRDIQKQFTLQVNA